MPASGASGLINISLVCLTTADQDRAIAFYVDVLGFEKRTDTPFGNGYRWVEVYPPEGETGIALAPPPDSATTAGGANTGITITTDDVDGSHACGRRRRCRGVTYGRPGAADVLAA
jgi:catechol 2,3-dioxygenase-like lactoylglutathione lyase family enzyme